MRDRFEHLLYEKLRDHAERPEPRDWTAVERSLGLDAKPRRAVPLWRSVAAVVLLLVAVGGYYLWRPQQPADPMPLAGVPQGRVPALGTFGTLPAEDTGPSEALAAVQKLKDAIDRASAPVLSPVEVAHRQPSAPPQASLPGEPAGNRDAPQRARPDENRRYTAAAPLRPLTVRRMPNRNWALSLFANGMGSSRGGGSSAERMLLALNQGQAYSDMSGNWSGNVLADPDISSKASSAYLIQYDQGREEGLLMAEMAEWQHARPVGGGFRVRRNLTGRWGLETGLEYTYLSSKQQTSSVLRRQELHYLGIPLAVTFTPLRTSSVELYLRAGGTADLNIAGRTLLTTDGVQAPAERFTNRNIQWSVGANLGAMYRFTPTLGLYLEPGVSHRFEFAGQPRSYWSEHPTGATLQVGIRADF